MEILLSVLPPQLSRQVKANCDFVKSNGRPRVQFYSEKCQHTLSVAESFVTYLTQNGQPSDVEYANNLCLLVRSINKTLTDNSKLLPTNNPKSKNTGTLIAWENSCNVLLGSIKKAVNDFISDHRQKTNQLNDLINESVSIVPPEWQIIAFDKNISSDEQNKILKQLQSLCQKSASGKNTSSGEQDEILKRLQSLCQTGTSDQNISSGELDVTLKQLELNLSSADLSNIDAHCLSLFSKLDYFSDPKTKLLKNLTAQEIKYFSKWITAFDNAFKKYAQINADTISPICLKSITQVLTIFADTPPYFDNLKPLIKFLQSLNSPYFQKYHPQFADTLIRIFTQQLKKLNATIEEKAKKNESFKLDLGFKSKLIDAVNVLLPDWQSLNNKQHLELLSNIVTKHDESYWFDLIHTLTDHGCNHSHQLSSDPWQQSILAQLESHDPAARQMLTAIFNQNPSAALQIETNNHRLLWLKAALYNKAGDHPNAYNAITRAEQRCDELGITTEPRLQLEIARIKLNSFKAMPNNNELSSDALHHIIKQLDKLGEITKGCTRFNSSGLHQLKAWTEQECAQVKQLKAEAQALKRASGRTSPPQVQSTKENDQPPLREATAPVMPPLETLPPTKSPKVICQEILRHLRVEHHRNQPEALTPNDTFMVMASNGKPVSEADAMKRDNWNIKITGLLGQVNAHRSDGDFINELLTYQDILTSPTNKQALGIHRLLLELSWTLMRHVDHARREDTLTKAEYATLLDYAWEFMMLSVCRAMRRSSAFPENLPDEQLVTTVIEWVQALQDPKLKREMEFFMRCALGSTAGHINGFRAELFPERKHLEQRATHFFNAKHRLQPGYVKPQYSEDRQMRSVCMSKPQEVRW